MTITKSQTVKVLTGCSNLYVTIEDGVEQGNGKIFFSTGKTGGCMATNLEALARMATLVLECGGSLKDIQKQLKGLRCPSPCFISDGNEVLSCADGIAKAIEIYNNENKNIDINKEEGRNEY